MSCYTAFRSPYSLIQDRNNLHDVSSGRTPQAPNITKLRGSSVKRLALFIEDKVTIDTFSFNIDSKNATPGFDSRSHAASGRAARLGSS
jgi:hypothetical protein